MKHLTILLAISINCMALEPAAKMMSQSLDSIVKAVTPTAQAIACPYLYCWSVPAITAEGETVLAFIMVGDDKPLGHRPAPKQGERYLKRIYTNKPPHELFTLIRRVYSDCTFELVEVERASEEP